MELYCGTYEEEDTFYIQIARKARIDKVKEVIVDTYKDVNKRFVVDPRLLTLYLARANDVWLPDNRDTDAFLRGEVSSQYPKMRTTRTLDDDEYFGSTLDPPARAIHVLVKLPPLESPDATQALKRRKIEEERKDISLTQLWQYVDGHLLALPAHLELAKILARPFPFRLELADSEAAKQLFDEDAPFIKCQILSSFFNVFLHICKSAWDPTASENSWQMMYDELLIIPQELCRAKGLAISMHRNHVDKSTSTKGLKPDLIMAHQGLVLLRGEEKNFSSSVDEACGEITMKMLKWNPMFYGNLPYILGYATSGSELKIVTIDRNLQMDTIVEFASIFDEKVKVVKTFYNLSAIIANMIRLSKKTCSSDLIPFHKHLNEKRSIILLDGMVQRTVKREQCEDDTDFHRLVDIYRDLRTLNTRVRERTHLQTVYNFVTPGERNARFIVQLQPLGFRRNPATPFEVREWLRCMLIALKYWHGSNYCHGDLRWRNIVYVPTNGEGYWVLIDMDESHRPDTKKITWNHQFRDCTLNFQHDLSQLGYLMMRLPATALNDKLVQFKFTLLEAVKTGLTAEGALALLSDIAAAEE